MALIQLQPAVTTYILVSYPDAQLRAIVTLNVASEASTTILRTVFLLAPGDKLRHCF